MSNPYNCTCNKNRNLNTRYLLSTRSTINNENIKWCAHMVKVLGHPQEMHHVYRCEILAHDINANKVFTILKKLYI
jgi:hypothetical protein